MLALALTPGAATAGTDERSWSPPALTGEVGDLPEGRDVVERAIDFMKSHDRVGFEAVSTYEAVQENGQKLQFTMLQRVVMQLPDRIFWTTLYDNAKIDMAWCKGGTFTMIKQPANIWARVKVPEALSDAVSRLSEEYKVDVPFVDLLSGDISELWLGEQVEYVRYIGEAWIDGHWTDHVALRRPGVDVQLWFRQGDQPFPMKMAIVHTDEEGKPGFWARFRKWSTQVPDSAIPKFEPPEGSEQLQIAPVIRP
jgi:hypothetical protein